MNKYIVIPNIKITNANAQPVWWIIGPPALTAYAGFAHALALSLGFKTHNGVAIVHHDIQFLGETFLNKYRSRTFYPQQFRASVFIDRDDYAGSGMSLSSQPTARCHLNVSLIILLPEKDNTISAIHNFLRSARIAGGDVIQYDPISIVETPMDALTAIKKTGYSIINRQDLMVTEEGDRDILDALLRHTSHYKANQDIKSDMHNQSNQWLMATCLGYIGISSLEQRKQARNDLPHLYVEPLVGLIQYKKAKDVGLHFWRYSYTEPNIFSLTSNL